MRLISVSLLFVLLVVSSATAQDQLAGSVMEANNPTSTTQYTTVPVYHDATGRTMNQWSPLERCFYEDACRKGSKCTGEIYEMFCANPPVIHPSTDGRYCLNMDAHINTVYQAWTGPAKARVPVIQGPAGREGAPGPQGPMGPQGPPGETITVPQTINYNFAPMYYPSAQMLGPMAPWIFSNQLGGVSWVTPTRIRVSVSAIATGGSVGPITNNNSNSNAVTSVNTNAVNVGSGSATGAGSGSSTAGSTSGH